MKMKNLKNVMYAGLGLAKQTEDHLKDGFDLLVIKGKRIDEEAENLVNQYFKIIEDIKKDAGKKFNTKLNDSIDKVEEFLQELKTPPTKD